MTANVNDPNEEYLRLLQGDTHLERLRAFVDTLSDEEAHEVLLTLIPAYAPNVIPPALVEHLIAVLSAIPEVEIVEAQITDIAYGMPVNPYCQVAAYYTCDEKPETLSNLVEQFRGAIYEVENEYHDYLGASLSSIQLTDKLRAMLERSPNVIFRRERQTSNEG